MGKIKVSDELKLKEAQYQKLLGFWLLIRKSLESAESVIDSYQLTHLNQDSSRLEIFGFVYILEFSHNFKLGQVSYHTLRGQETGERLLSVQFDQKGNLGQPYANYKIADFASVNFYVLDSLSSANQLTR